MFHISEQTILAIIIITVQYTFIKIEFSIYILIQLQSLLTLTRPLVQTSVLWK